MAQSLNKPSASTTSPTLSSTTKKSLRAKFRIAKKEVSKDSSDEDKSEDENDITPSPKTSKTASTTPQQKKLPPSPESIEVSVSFMPKTGSLESPILNNIPNDSPSSLDIYEEKNDEEDKKCFFSSLIDDQNSSTFSSHLIVTDDVLSQPMYSTQSADSNLTTASTEDSIMDSWPMPNFIDSDMFPIPDAWVDSSSIDTDFMDDAFMQDMIASQNHQLPVIESARPRSRLQKVKTGLGDSFFENDTFMGGMPDSWNTNSPLPLNDIVDTVAPLHT